MPGRRHPPATLERAMESLSRTGSPNQTARDIGIPTRTASYLWAKNSPFIEQYRELNEPSIRAGWRYVYENTMEMLYAGGISPADYLRLVMAGNIASQALAAWHNRPIAITATIHEHRVSLGDVAEKLLNVAKAVTQEATRHSPALPLGNSAPAAGVILEAE